MANEKYFSIEEVNLHKYPDDIWLIKDGKVQIIKFKLINLKVYNLTCYYKSHPGGDAMLKYAGKDISIAINNVVAHGFSREFIENKLSELYIGKIK
uniref:Cytochrome b5 heme-binding domain-containing protein n=1 Tax=Meloidogyne floridensis TaxID=298350 RepID=A0A915NQ44_9BILA